MPYNPQQKQTIGLIFAIHYGSYQVRQREVGTPAPPVADIIAEAITNFDAVEAAIDAL